jgi:flavin-dependent dehydrogenase
LKKGSFHRGRVLVAGDAAGLTDSLTGEGIYYTIRSGRLAADACFRFIHGENDAFRSYSDQVNDELMTELLEGDKIKHIFNVVPLKIHLFVRDSDRAWRAFGKVLRGERSYRDVKTGFGRWKVLWNSASYLAGFYEKIKTWKYRKKDQ